MAYNEIVDQGRMEDFFQKRLDIFPGAVKLLELKIFQHDPSLVISKDVILVKYELLLENKDGALQKLALRGSTDPTAKRLKSYHILQALWNSGFSSGRFVVPRPWGYFPEYQLLLYENYPGESLMQLFESGQNHYSERVATALDWLAVFHEKKPQSVPEAYFNWDAERTEFRRLVNHVCANFSSQRQRIQNAAAKLIAQEKILLDTKGFSLVHGDFQPNNILLNQQQIAVIDFNDAFLYDELFDLAYFTTQVQFMLQHLRGITLATELKSLETHYLNQRRIPKSAMVEKKLALFRAKTLLKIKSLTSQTLGAKILIEIEENVKKTI